MPGAYRKDPPPPIEFRREPVEWAQVMTDHGAVEYCSRMGELKAYYLFTFKIRIPARLGKWIVSRFYGVTL